MHSEISLLLKNTLVFLHVGHVINQFLGNSDCFFSVIYFEVYFLPSTIISESGAYSDIATLRSRFKSYSSRGTPFSYICKSTTSTGNPYFGITQYFDKYLITSPFCKSEIWRI